MIDSIINLIPIIKKAIKTIFLNKAWETCDRINSPILNPIIAAKRLIKDLIIASWVKTPEKYNPAARGKLPDRKRNPEIQINLSFE